jgi:hypothetical protein
MDRLSSSRPDAVEEVENRSPAPIVHELHERLGVLFLRQPDLINNHVVTPFVVYELAFLAAENCFYFFAPALFSVPLIKAVFFNHARLARQSGIRTIVLRVAPRKNCVADAGSLNRRLHTGNRFSRPFPKRDS